MFYLLMEQTDDERGPISVAFRKLVYDASPQVRLSALTTLLDAEFNIAHDHDECRGYSRAAWANERSQGALRSKASK
jgi:hypothetical protein